VCAELALELALKSRLQLESKAPPHKHSALTLFNLLSPSARDEILAELKSGDSPIPLTVVLIILGEFEGTSEGW